MTVGGWKSKFQAPGWRLGLELVCRDDQRHRLSADPSGSTDVLLLQELRVGDTRNVGAAWILNDGTRPENLLKIINAEEEEKASALAERQLTATDIQI